MSFWNQLFGRDNTREMNKGKEAPRETNSPQSLEGEWTLIYDGDMIETLKICDNLVRSVLDRFGNPKRLVRASPGRISGGTITFGYVLYNETAQSEVVREVSGKRDSVSEVSGTMMSSITVSGQKDTKKYPFKMSRG